MSEKEFKTYKELLSLLGSRGVDLSTSALRGSAKRAIQHEGYYRLINGYKGPFLSSSNPEDQYIVGTTVDQIYDLCKFDRRLRSLCLSSILYIESNIKNIIAYTFSSMHGHKNYLVMANFDTSQRDGIESVTKLFASIQKQISSRWSDPSIKHYLSEYGYIPLWVLNNILTLGDVSKFYSLMKQPERQAVAKVFKMQDHELKSFLTYLSSVRNICAHDNRLFCFRTKRPISDMSIHSKLCIPTTKGEYDYGKRDLFALMIIFRLLLSKSRFKTLTKQIQKELLSLDAKLTVLPKDEILLYMGFPNDWYKKLDNYS